MHGWYNNRRTDKRIDRQKREIGYLEMKQEREREKKYVFLSWADAYEAN